MTPKEKAEQLMNKFFNYCSYEWYEGEQGHKENMKQCALIAVDEILKSEPLEPNNIPEWLQPEDWFSEANKSAGEYWVEVKKEIEAL